MTRPLLLALLLLASPASAAEQHTWYVCTHSEHQARNGDLPLGAKIVGAYLLASEGCSSVLRHDNRTVARQAGQPGTHRFDGHWVTVTGPVSLKAWAGRDAAGERIPCYAHADVYYTCEPPCVNLEQTFGGE